MLLQCYYNAITMQLLQCYYNAAITMLLQCYYNAANQLISRPLDSYDDSDYDNLPGRPTSKSNRTNGALLMPSRGARGQYYFILTFCIGLAICHLLEFSLQFFFILKILCHEL